MSEQKDLAKTTSSVTPFRGEKIQIQKVPFYNREQFKRVLETLKAANMSFYEAAKAGLDLGYEVIVGEKDAPIRAGGWEEEQGKVKEEDHKIIAWQRRGEVTSINPQLSSPVGEMDNKIAVISHDLTVPEGEGVIEVIEGIEISVEEKTALEQPPQDQEAHDQALENSRFLKVA